jgi:hypothetical protein
MNDHLKDLEDELYSLKQEVELNGEYLNESDVKHAQQQIVKHQSLIDDYDKLKLRHEKAKEAIIERRNEAHLRRSNG